MGGRPAHRADDHADGLLHQELHRHGPEHRSCQRPCAQQVDEELSTIRLTRLVAAYAAGRILNAQTARSQYLGGLVFGIGMALHEETRFDRTSGMVTNRNLTDYLVPTHADMPDFDIHLIEESDDILDNGGVKGIGMIGYCRHCRRDRECGMSRNGRPLWDAPDPGRGFHRAIRDGTAKMM
jgi:hypothetical protein